MAHKRIQGDEITWQVLRGGAPMTLDIGLAAPQPLVPLHLAGADPSFLIVAGRLYVFRVLLLPALTCRPTYLL